MLLLAPFGRSAATRGRMKFNTVLENWLQLPTPENTITYHNALWLTPHILHKQCFQFLVGVKMAQEKLKTMIMQNLGVTNKEHYGMLWYFLEWSIEYYRKKLSRANC